MALSSNSTVTPLTSLQAFQGIYENVKNFTGISVLCKCDSTATLLIQHSSNGVDVDYTDTFSVVADVPVFKQVVLKSKYVKVRLTNTSGSDQTYLRLFTKLLTHTAGDEMNVKLDENDSIIVKGANGVALNTDASGNLAFCVDINGVATETTLSGARGVLDDVSSKLTDLNTTANSLMTNAKGDSVIASLSYLATEASLVGCVNGLLDVSGKLTDMYSVLSSIKSNTTAPEPVSVFRSYSLSTTPEQIGSISVKLEHVMFDNESVNILYFRFYDAVSSPSSADMPVLMLSCNHNVGVVDIKLSSPVVFYSGCWVVCSSNRDAVSDGFGTVAAGDVSVQCLYR
jgi:hypothetical protein